MKKIKKFFKAWWIALGDDLLEPPKEEPYPFNSPQKKDTSCYCPFCGYSGSMEDIRVHLLNKHKP